MSELYITNFISVKQLQKLQDSFSRMTGMAALTTDTTGTPVTEGSNFTKYCMEYTRNSKVGCERCHQCDIMGAKTTLETGKPVTYSCHSRLIDFAAPIMIDNTLVGSFIGGQVLAEEPDKEKIRQVAEDIGVPFEEYWDALCKVPRLKRERIDEAAEFLFEIANVISDIAYSKFEALKNAEEAERVANMKSDFLANMSHEIRTPMNAVIGMAEMALREDMTNAAKDYISQIKTSGNALLNIINDILDFSKIESGKMDIIVEEYEPLSVMHDISTILMTRLQDKDVELIGTINPNAPRLLFGDMLRIRQIVINIANNAVKFTEKGFVWVNIDFKKISEDEAEFIIYVKDTGIGIKEEDLGKLFDAFQQVDSRRNRNIEGTGLGLAITSRLLDLMGGSISVESEYGKGSLFTIKIPQKVSNWEPVITVNDKDKKAVIGYWKGLAGSRVFYESLKQMNVETYALISLDRMESLLQMYKDELEGKSIYLATTHEIYKNEMQEFVKENPTIQFVVVCDFFAKIEDNNPNVRFIKKPYSNLIMATVLNNEEQYASDLSSFEFDFIAPEAKVMIVDDNDVNLLVAEGLLEPLKMQVTKATSGREALELLENDKFDIVFMDHMMPELDGVETTRIIRRSKPELDKMPIIALTANAVGEAKKMFLAEGMNDFVAKPIEMRAITSAIRNWLPKEKILKKREAEVIFAEAEKMAGGGAMVGGDALVSGENGIVAGGAGLVSGGKGTVAGGPVGGEIKDKLEIGDLDIDVALSLIGNEKLYMTILEKYYSVILQKAETIRNSEKLEDVSTYTIEVHALKSSSKQIGAMELSKLAAELEKCGNANDVETIHQKTDALLEKYISYQDVLRPLFEKEDKKIEAKKAQIGRDELEGFFKKMLEACEELDMDGMEETAAEMDEFSFEGDSKALFERLKEATSNIDVDSVEEIIGEWRALL